MKGHTIIELHNMITGATERIEKENLVTHAIRDLFSINLDGLLYRESGLYFLKECIPICPKAMGGLLLFSNRLEEDPTKYYASSTNPVWAMHPMM